MNAQGLEGIGLGPERAAAAARFFGLGPWIGAAGNLPRPGVVLLTLVAAAFLVAMILVLQLQLQASRIATVNELERELAQLQRVRSALLVEAATSSDLPQIQQRAGELGMRPAEATKIDAPVPPGGPWISPPPAWSDPAPPVIPNWRERFWHALLRWTGRSPAEA